MDQLTAVPPAGATRPAGLSAGVMATAVAVDPQFTLPVRPRLLDHLVVVALPDGLVVEGAGDRQVLRGKAATELVPPLLRLLDGTRGLDDLAYALGRPLRHVHAALALLYACGLLEDAGHEPVPPPGGSPEVAAFLGRHLDTTRANRSVGAALARLAAARVTVLAGPDATRAVSDALRRAGVGQVAQTLPDIDRDRTELVIALAERADDALDEWCTRARVPWLRSAYTGAGIELGPRFEAGHTACHRCFAREWPVGPAQPSDRQRTAWYGLVVDEALALLSRVGKPASTGGVSVVDLADWRDRTVLVPRRPDCPRCFARPGPPGDEVPLALRYEQAVAFPPRHLLNPKDHQHHYKPANLALQNRSKQYPGAHHEVLPAAGHVPDGTVDRDALAGLLLRTAGRRDDAPGTGKVQRWAPTGGNLGSVQVYLLAVDVAGLSPAWYLYEPVQHRLALVRRCADAPGSARTGVVGAPPAPPRPAARHLAGRVADGPVPRALLVLTGALDRVATKYYDFACRIVYLDAGVATAQLQAVAHAHRLGTRVAHRWDDRLLHDELRLDPTAEPVTAVVGLFDGRPDGVRV